jgi:predicted nucleotidyltransferase
VEPQPQAWLDQLGPELSEQRAILRRLSEACEADANIRWLLIGCSLARGAGDGLSDLDLAMGVEEDRFDAAVVEVRRAVDHLSELVDSFHHQLPGVVARHERIFAQYANRCQVDLVVFAGEPPGSVPNAVVLYDPGHRLRASAEPQPVSAGQVRESAFLGWCALADLGKYVRRGSAWEALERLHEARGYFWRLWAMAHDIPQPQYGLTSVLDYDAEHLPPAAEATVSSLDLPELLSAARCLARLLNDIGNDLDEHHRAALPAAMARYVSDDLASYKIADPALASP